MVVESEPARASESSTTPAAARFDAFLAFTPPDRSVASAISKGLRHIGRRPTQLRALRVCNDGTDNAGAVAALDQSRYLIVVLSPEAAASAKVNDLVGHWLTQRGLANMLLVLAGGRLQWDAENACFDPERSDAAPEALTEYGCLPAEPFYIDVSEDAPWDADSAKLRDKITSLAAPIHGKPKDQLAGDDLREQKLFRRLRAAAVVALAVLIGCRRRRSDDGVPAASNLCLPT